MKIKSDGDVGGASGDAGDHDDGDDHDDAGDGDDASDRDAGDYVGDGDTESELDIPPDPPSPWMSLRPHKLERNVTMRGNDRPRTIPECPSSENSKIKRAARFVVFTSAKVTTDQLGLRACWVTWPLLASPALKLARLIKLGAPCAWLNILQTVQSVQSVHGECREFGN